MNYLELIAVAVEARKHAYAGYSNYQVGSAVVTGSGKVYSGCNVENSSYGLTVCAERVTVWKALPDGERDFAQIAVVTSSDPPASPCGACRQVLWECCGDIEVILANLEDKFTKLMLSELFPLPFNNSSL